MRIVYGCERRRGKNVAEILLDLAGKRYLGKTLYSRLLESLLPNHGIRPSRVLDVALDGSGLRQQVLSRSKLSGAKFFFDLTDDSLWTEYRNRFPAQSRTVIQEADRIVRHEFDLLGSGPRFWGDPIDWHVDPKSGYRWRKKFYAELLPVSALDKDADVKLPYELSRMQHLPTLGKAYQLTGNESYAEELVRQVGHWLDDNPYLIGINWTCAMDVGIRIVNIIWGMAFIEYYRFLSPAFMTRLLASIWQHGEYLVRHLEYSIGPDGRFRNHNHYLSNVVALVYLGLLFPEFKTARNWRHIGLESLVEEMDRQVDADGVDYESSLSYHRLVLELFTSAALLCRLNGVSLPTRFWRRLEKMYVFTLHVTRPDGKVPQIGDSDDGRLHILGDYGRWDRTDHRYLLSIGASIFRRGDMKARANTFSEEAFWLLGLEGANTFDALTDAVETPASLGFAHAGFYVMRSGNNYLLACCNPVGTGGAGNHKHNDLLSFELCVGGRAFIVDPGTYVYTADPEWRRRFRSTRFHNTVVVDGAEQNRFRDNTVFSIFADAHPITHEWHTSPKCDRLDVEHTGYRRLPGAVCHRRSFIFNKQRGEIDITDVLHGWGEHHAEWNFHFDHGVTLERTSASEFVAYSGDVSLRMTLTASLALDSSIEEAWVSRRYGEKLPAKLLEFQGSFLDECRVVFRAFQGNARE